MCDVLSTTGGVTRRRRRRAPHGTRRSSPRALSSAIVIAETLVDQPDAGLVPSSAGGSS